MKNAVMMEPKSPGTTITAQLSVNPNDLYIAYCVAMMEGPGIMIAARRKRNTTFLPIQLIFAKENAAIAEVITPTTTGTME